MAGGPNTPIYENILVNMADGVISLDLEGHITTFNPAAGRVLAMHPDDVVGRTYAEIFFEDPGLDDFNELVLRAIYESQTTHSQEIEITRGGEGRNLNVSTTFLRTGTGEDAEKLGVIVVLNDVTEQRKRKKIKRLFGEFVDPRIVDTIIGQVDIDEAGVRQKMTILFCDLEGFTRLAEGLTADQLIRFVNIYLTLMSEPVARHGGVTDKYIGDAIMAFWGPPFTDRNSHAVQACRAALDQRNRLDELRRQVAADIGPEIDVSRIDMRCGVATGEVVAGSVGPRQSRNYTVIGDPVNVAARLEAANKELGVRILVSEDTWHDAQSAFEFRELDRLLLRGRSRAERVFELLGARGEVADARTALRDRFEAGLVAQRRGDLGAARDAFAECVALAPDDRPSRLMLERVAAGGATS
ncbi:MAG: adenylate/guanylate cyclase domain-containing protein [Dongiaceae bacterium]